MSLNFGSSSIHRDILLGMGVLEFKWGIGIPIFEAIGFPLSHGIFQGVGFPVGYGNPMGYWNSTNPLEFQGGPLLFLLDIRLRTQIMDKWLHCVSSIFLRGGVTNWYKREITVEESFKKSH